MFIKNPKAHPILLWVKNRVKNNKNAIIVFLGATGSGKTYAALRMGQLLSKMLGTSFTIDGNVGFSSKEILELTRLPENQKPGTVFVFEEVGAFGSGGASRQWQSQTNFLFGSFLQTTRHRRQILIFTCPDYGFLDNMARKLIHAQGIMKGIDYDKGVSRVKFLINSMDFSSGKLYRKYLRIYVAGARQKIKTIEFTKPDKESLIRYEERKTIFTDQLNDKILAGGEKKEGGSVNKIDSNRFLELVKEGMPKDEIAKYFDCGLGTVQNYFNKYRKEIKELQPDLYMFKSKKSFVNVN